jgi:hypothetical protein
VLEFLTFLFYEGFQYRTINVHRSAISSVLTHINDLLVNTIYEALIMKGVLSGNPPLPRHQTTGMWIYMHSPEIFWFSPSHQGPSLETFVPKLNILAIIDPKQKRNLTWLFTTTYRHRGQTSNGYKRSCAGYKRDLALDTNVPYGILL